MAARWVHYASTISLAGVFAFLCFVVGPKVSPRLHRRLWSLAWASLALAALSGVAWLLLLSVQMSGQPILATLTQGVAGTVLTRTRFGEIWVFRFALAVLLAALLLMPRGWRGRPWRWGGLALSAGILAALAWAGHGGATPGRPGDLHLAADMLHLLAAGAWVGSLIPLALLLAETRQSGDPGPPATARHAVARFSMLAAISVAILLAAGLVNTWFLAGTVPALIGTEYGRLLLAKVAILIMMVAFGSVNLLRMTPRLAPGTGGRRPLIQSALGHLHRNALVEAGLGLCVLAIVAVLGILPPGLHTEPGWPLPFRLELAALAARSKLALATLIVLAGVLAVGGAAAAAAGRYRMMIATWGGLALCAALGALLLWPAVETAYPTTFYAPAEPYAATSVEHGARLFAESCALCHGADGKGDGPAAAALTVRPADLTAPHLLMHTEGDLFWWVSHGKANGAMPGFAGVMSPGERWDVINFVRARAAGILSQAAGPEVSATAAPAVPDFAFESGGRQQTLNSVLQNGPALVALIAGPRFASRAAGLAAVRKQLAAAGLRVLAIGLGSAAGAPTEASASSPLVGVAADVAATLALFRAPDDGGETDLMLDRAGNVRARWTAGGAYGLPDTAILVVNAARVARFPAAAENHAAHPH